MEEQMEKKNKSNIISLAKMRSFVLNLCNKQRFSIGRK
jgi:hypothetical protein